MLRKYHRLISLIIALPLLVVILTGLALQLRQQFEVLQPKAVKMEKIIDKALLSTEEIIKYSGVAPENIDQIIFRPTKFHLALRLKNGREIQMHPQTGEILKSAPRYTNILIELHQGSFLGPWGQYGVILPTGIGLFFLLISGLMIFPWRKKHG